MVPIVLRHEDMLIVDCWLLIHHAKTYTDSHSSIFLQLPGDSSNETFQVSLAQILWNILVSIRNPAVESSSICFEFFQNIFYSCFRDYRGEDCNHHRNGIEKYEMEYWRHAWSGSAISRDDKSHFLSVVLIVTTMLSWVWHEGVGRLAHGMWGQVGSAWTVSHTFLRPLCPLPAPWPMHCSCTSLLLCSVSNCRTVSTDNTSTKPAAQLGPIILRGVRFGCRTAVCGRMHFLGASNDLFIHASFSALDVHLSIFRNLQIALSPVYVPRYQQYQAAQYRPITVQVCRNWFKVN